MQTKEDKAHDVNRGAAFIDHLRIEDMMKWIRVYAALFISPVHGYCCTEFHWVMERGFGLSRDMNMHTRTEQRNNLRLNRIQVYTRVLRYASP